MATQNYKRVWLLSAIASYGGIVTSIIVGLVSVPIGVRYFGPVLYGIWFVISSILAYLRATDFGVGLSTLTLLAQAPQPSHHRIILRRSLGMLLGMSILFVSVLIVINYTFPGWVGILGKIPLSLEGEVVTAAFTIGILVLLRLPLNIFPVTFSGLQQVHWNRMYGALNSLIALGALVTTVLVKGNLVTLAFLTGVGGLLVGAVSGLHLFLAHPQVRPRLSERVADAPTVGVLFTSGIRFLILQIAALVILNTDNIIISHHLGYGEVTLYAISFKLFRMGLMVVTSIIAALWPMYGQALRRDDWEWMQRTYNWSIFLQIIPGGMIWIGGVIFSQTIINLWVGPDSYGGLLVSVALGGYIYVSTFGGSNVSLINGLNPTNIVVVFGIIEAILNLGISLALVQPLGIGGVALGTFAASLAVNTWFHPLYIWYRTSKRVTIDAKSVLAHAGVSTLCVALSLLVVLNLEGWTQFVFGIVIIGLYVTLSWRVMPSACQDLIGKALPSLRTHLTVDGVQG